MEKKTKHRILGILVVIGLVIISLPFFQGSGHDSSTTLINAPAFPDQSVQVEANQPAETTPSTTAIQTSPIPMHDPSAETGINQLPDDTIAPNAGMPSAPAQAPSMGQPDKGLVVPNPDSSNGPSANTPDDAGEPSPNNDEGNDTEDLPSKNGQQISEVIPDAPAAQTAVATPKAKKAQMIKKQMATTPKMRSAANKPATNDINGLLKLKQSVWVIQLGSFKNKENALRLVNKLRMKGYHAFIQQVDARTRVFVGPEEKQPIARMVASQLEEEMHISGIVISYKPLVL